MSKKKETSSDSINPEFDELKQMSKSELSEMIEETLESDYYSKGRRPEKLLQLLILLTTKK